MQGDSDIDAKTSAYSLVENTSVNFKQCRKMKSSAKTGNRVRKLELNCMYIIN